jgi:hypothetical protein
MEGAWWRRKSRKEKNKMANGSSSDVHFAVSDFFCGTAAKRTPAQPDKAHKISRREKAKTAKDSVPGLLPRRKTFCCMPALLNQ